MAGHVALVTGGNGGIGLGMATGLAQAGADITEPGKANQAFVDSTVKRTPVRRWAAPGEFGRVAVYLADPLLTFHTGDCVVADGGYTIN